MDYQNQTCTESDVAGASFSIHPMSNRFIEIIKSALTDVDTSKVNLITDDVTTTVKGNLVHIFDVTKAMFLHAAKTGEHVAFQATYSFGCPGDSKVENDMEDYEDPINAELVKGIEQYVAAKFSLYPFGGDNYMDIIHKQIEAMRKYVTVSAANYSTRLDGDALTIFEGLEQVFKATIDSGSNHTVMTVSISANSPSHMKKGIIEKTIDL
ncbi:YkoF family thiamine/hydroxymethylpyrimidine-binding protein [Oceanobacillus chungangensis]|uniref:Thiamine-binding protein n=1 Tax=Oceanobacillus chungangensis TaxID=1229152 RepID=A0A3D8PS78_9BACI|nr:YkoF family thiamine/hydroxymethylpyrimidine-binding protein [Oceanobacillus chungangensis]RDW18019.1 thiamine-binding protein [Oceanobacillus chungangensis]